MGWTVSTDYNWFIACILIFSVPDNPQAELSNINLLFNDILFLDDDSLLDDNDDGDGWWWPINSHPEKVKYVIKTNSDSMQLWLIYTIFFLM